MTPNEPRSVGVLHVHSDESGSGGTLQEVVEAAEDCGLDFVILTDRGTRGYGERLEEGWHGRVFVMFGEEVSTPDGHFLVLGGRESVGRQETLSMALQAARGRKVLRASIHHQLVESPAGRNGAIPPPVPFEDVDLMEIWSFYDDFLAHVSARSFRAAAEKPEKLLEGPSRRLLRAWDAELERRPLPIAGGLNAHRKKHPLLDWAMLFPYRTSFGTVHTVIPGVQLDRRAEVAETRRVILGALRQGKCYVANEALAPSAGFDFTFAPGRGKKRWPIGAQAALGRGGVLHVSVPEKAEIVLRLGGQPLFWGTGRRLDFPCVLPGIYRVEVFLERRMWILTNPIRIHSRKGGPQPTVSDVT